MAFFDGYLSKIGDTLHGVLAGITTVLVRKADNTAIMLAGNDRGAALVEIDGSTAGSHEDPIVAPQTNAGAMGTIATLTPRGISIYAPDGSEGGVANTASVAVGYSGLTLANGVLWVEPGASLHLPCASLAEAFSVSSAAGQTLRIGVL